MGTRTLVGLIGTNILKSLSPALHEDAMAAAGMSGHYHLMDLDQLPGARLDSVFAGVKATGFRGVNVTFPFKQAIMPLLDEVSVEAQQIGAVNTVTISEHGSTRGHNTDRIGFLRGFEEGLGRDCIAGKPVLLVGAGGAGRAVCFALMDLGAAEVAIHDVDRGRAAALIADVMQHYGAARCRLADDIVKCARTAAGIVNATPVGMSRSAGNPVPVEAILAHHWVADIIYTPLQTELIKAALAKGARVLTADGMTVHQAAVSFQLFTGVTPDAGRLRRVFMSALVQRDARLANGSPVQFAQKRRST